MTDRKLSYKERWQLAYGESFDDWFDRTTANGDYIIPSCMLEDKWTEKGVPLYESEVENYITTNNKTPQIPGVYCTNRGIKHFKLI